MTRFHLKVHYICCPKGFLNYKKIENDGISSATYERICTGDVR